MKTVNQMIMLVKEASKLSKDKEIEDLLGIRPMGLASLKKENRVGSFLKFLVPFCEKENISIDDFLKDDLKEVDENDNVDVLIKSEKEEEMYRLKYEQKCEEVIHLQNMIIEITNSKKATLSKKKLG
jgi:hypothetical protein